MKKQFIQAIFCPPNDQYQEYNLPSRLTDEVFSYLKDMKINRIFGWGYDSRKTTIEKMMDMCEKYNISYLPTLEVNHEYLRIESDDKGKAFFELNEEEIKRLDERFIRDFYPYTLRKCVKGIFFSDESGYLGFKGIIHAKEVFEKAYPGYEFHVNFFSYTINEQMFWTSFNKPDYVVKEEWKPFKLEGKYEVNFANRFNYYDLFVDGLLAKSHFNYFSFDKYPFEIYWDKCPHFMHRCYIESVALLRKKKEQYHSNFYAYIGVGQWFENAPKTLLPSEFSLSMHILALYGCDGFAYFPGLYPVDFVTYTKLLNSDNGQAGLLDINGKPTIFYHELKKLNEYFSLIEDDLLNSELISVKSYGEYYNGFTKEDVKDVKDNEVIFFGEEPPFYNVDKQNIKVKKTTNNIFISEFKKDNKAKFYLVNMSTLFSNDIEIELPKGNYQLLGVNRSISFNEELKITLQPGEGIYIIDKT